MTMNLTPIRRTAAPTIVADIYIAGCYATAVEALRGYAMKGACYNLVECDYIYTGGMERGVKIGLINYPRFPVTAEVLQADAVALADHMIRALFQGSATVVGPIETVFLDRRYGQ